ncbi:RDD family protein [Flexivirga sp.]|uniref:RDD family protein n=1 Tax=Flexivirga sp. TaxID=1962927 RepID=UPI003F7D1249
MSERASGWYDDPQDPSQLRYWDGILWSDRTMPKVKPNLEQSRIGDARRQYEEEQERRRAAEEAEAARYGQRQGQRPQLRPYEQTPHQQTSQHYPGGQQSPYSRQPYVPQPVKTAPDGEPTASWWRRLLAYLIDNVLLSLLAFAISWSWLHPWISTIINWYDDAIAAAQDGRSQPPLPGSFYHVPWQFPVVALALYLVYEIGLVAWRGQTIGHLICGIRVRGAATSTRPSLRAAAIRAVVKGVGNITSLLPILGPLGTIFTLVDGLIPLGDRSAQALHDKAAQTYVVPARRSKTDVSGWGGSGR